MDELWRRAGGGTPLYSPERFAVLLNTAPGISAPKTCGDCTGRAPHNCWFAAVGAAVAASRARKRTRKPVPVPDALFTVTEAEMNPAPFQPVSTSPACGRTAKHMPQAGAPASPRERTR
jgi:hypothetical protein